jgi:hypothetical protein
MLVELNIGEEEELFYYYLNWQANQPNKIHKATCGYCNYGTGSKKFMERGENGVWIGPFSNIELCEQFVVGRLNLEPIHCGCC